MSIANLHIFTKQKSVIHGLTLYKNIKASIRNEYLSNEPKVYQIGLFLRKQQLLWKISSTFSYLRCIKTNRRSTRTRIMYFLNIFQLNYYNNNQTFLTRFSFDLFFIASRINTNINIIRFFLVGFDCFLRFIQYSHGNSIYFADS